MQLQNRLVEFKVGIRIFPMMKYFLHFKLETKVRFNLIDNDCNWFLFVVDRNHLEPAVPARDRVISNVAW